MKSLKIAVLGLLYCLQLFSVDSEAGIINTFLIENDLVLRKYGMDKETELINRNNIFNEKNEKIKQDLIDRAANRYQRLFELYLKSCSGESIGHTTKKEVIRDFKDCLSERTRESSGKTQEDFDKCFANHDLMWNVIYKGCKMKPWEIGIMFDSVAKN